MPQQSLSQRAEQEFIELLLADWGPSEAVGFDLDDQPGDEGLLPVARSLESVGDSYPHLTVQRTNETSGGETTYDFLTTNGPGQNRTGQLLVTARAEVIQDGYTGDSATHSAVDAEAIVDRLIAAVENVCLRNPQGGDSSFSYCGSQRGADAPDDYDPTPPVFIEQCTVAYGWIRTP